MAGENITVQPTMAPGEVMRAYDYDAPAPEAVEAETPAADPAPETPTVEAPHDIETPQSLPDAETIRLNLLRDFHAKSQTNAARARELEAREQALAQKIEQYRDYEEFGRMAEADPELAALIAERIPRARGLAGNRQTADQMARENAALREQVIQTQMDQVEIGMKIAHPDWDSVSAEVTNTLLEANMLNGVTSSKQLRAAYELAYKAVTGNRQGTQSVAAAQRKIVDQVKAAAAAARTSAPAPQPAPPPEPSSFDRTGRLRSWGEIAAEQLKRP